MPSKPDVAIVNFLLKIPVSLILVTNWQRKLFIKMEYDDLKKQKNSYIKRTSPTP